MGLSTERLLLDAPNLVDVVRRRAEALGDRVAYTFLSDGESAEETLTYGELDRRARALGASLRELGAPGEPVLLLHPPGLDYVVAVCGCLYAGMVAVPAYPPDPLRLARTLPRLVALVGDAGAKVALTTSAIYGLAEALFEHAPSLRALRWVPSDAAGAGPADAWRAPPGGREGLAILQYTSGSTGAPRGVMLSHGNLLHNSWLIHRCFGHGPESRGVIWLPPYHDMGLIGGVLQPLCGGFPVTLMSPLDFLARPMRWLRAVSRRRATTSGGPNFAYDLCARKATPDEVAGLDLGAWEVAFNGAEPVRAETLDRFCEVFGPAGFRREAFYPCYGLAEGTLIATGGAKAAAPVVRTFGRAGLAAGRAEPPAAGAPAAGASALVGSGGCLPGQRLLIVDPQTGAACAPGRVGEVWLAGPSVAAGYWRREAETAATFGARAASSEGPFLRTGDLGFLDEGGELFVVGRAKDVIIVRGRNHYPQDVERTAERCHPAVRPGCSAAFGLEVGGEERLGVVVEVDPRRGAEASRVLDAVRRAIADEHGLAAHVVAAVAPGAVPKTSSGKVQRGACRELFRRGELEPLGVSEAGVEAAGGEAGAGAVGAAGPTRDEIVAAGPGERPALVLARLRAEAARLLRVAPERVDVGRPLVAQGLDSLLAVELGGALEAGLGVSLPLASFFDERGLEGLAREAARALEGGAGPRLSPGPRSGPLPLSFAQQRLWFLSRLSPASSAYHLPVALALAGPLDAGALARAVDELVRRHEALRTTFHAEGGGTQRVHGHRPGALAIEEAAVDGGPEAEARAALRLADDEAARPFDLEAGPPFRARLVRLAAERHVLLLTAHHIVADGWSMGVLSREISALYRAFRDGGPPPLGPLPAQYGDFAAAQRRWLDGARCEAHVAARRRSLAGAPPLLALAGARERPAAQTFRGAHHAFGVPAALVRELEALARREGATLFMALLAGFFAALRAAGAGDDVVAGTDAAGRGWAGTEGLIGLFVNQLVVRADLSGDPSGVELVRRARASALDAYAHEELPFDKLVEGLRPPRDPRYNPLFQAMFVLENAPVPAPELAGVRAELLPAPNVGSPFDLSLLLTPAPGGAPGLQGLLKYNPDLFEAGAAERVADAFGALLEALAARPEAPLSALTSDAARALEGRRGAELERLRAARRDRWGVARRR
ncbi:MAG TPA: condensation domain-containing protein [Polyangiaceae bacterium]|nr:condensation domain-containing protein [Polyangiaceae bacterium]